MKILSKEAIKILRQAKIDILCHPENYDQWEPYVPKFSHNCGSVGCIYGYIATRHPEGAFGRNCEENLINYKVLGLPDRYYYGTYVWPNGIEEGVNLYDHWPAELAEMLYEAKTKMDKALVAATCIELFIITDGFSKW